MRVSEFAKELGKSNKEVLDMLAEKGITGKTHSSNITDEEARAVRTSAPQTRAAAGQDGGAAASASYAGAPAARTASGQAAVPSARTASGQAAVPSARTASGQTAVPAAAGQNRPAAGQGESAAAGRTQPAAQGGTAQAGAAQNGTAQAAAAQSGTAQPGQQAAAVGAAQPKAAPKKKLTAVYRPQNSETMKNARPGQNQGKRDGLRPQGQQGSRPAGTPGAAPQGLRPAGTPAGSGQTVLRQPGTPAAAATAQQSGRPQNAPAGVTGSVQAGGRPQSAPAAAGSVQAGGRPQSAPAGVTGSVQAGGRPQSAPAAARSAQQGGRPQSAPAGVTGSVQAGGKPQSTQAGGKPQSAPAAAGSEQQGGRPQEAAAQGAAVPRAAAAAPSAGQTQIPAENTQEISRKTADQVNHEPERTAQSQGVREAEKQAVSAADGSRTEPVPAAAGAAQPAASSQNAQTAGRDGSRAQGQTAGGTDARVQSQGLSSRQSSQAGRDANRGQGGAGGRDGNRDGGRDGSRDGGRDGSRDAGRDGSRGGLGSSRDGGRDANRGSFAGRDANSGSRDGGRDGNRDGGRDGNRGSFGGSRDGSREGGRDGNRGSFSGSRDGNRDGSRDGGRDGSRGSFGGSREVSRDGNRGSFGGNRDGSRDGSRDGGRDGSRGGFGGSRDGNREGSYGSRDGSRGSFGGSRDGSYGGSRDGSRDGSRGSFGGSRDGSRGGFGGSREGGFGGSRDGNRDGSRGGFAGRDGSYGGGREGGYGGSRDGGRDGSRGGFGGRDSRDGARDGGRDARGGQGSRGGFGGRDSRDISKSFDTPIATKPQSSRAQKNAHKNDRYDNKKSMNEDGPRTKGKSVTNKHPFIMPQKTAEAKVEDSIKVITIPESLTIKDLAEKMKLQPSAIVKKLFLKGTVVTLNQEIDYEQAEEIAMEYDVLCEKEEKEDVIGELLREDEESEDDMVARPPVVCVMGHVDHGKTSLLDAIRQTNVTSHEAGGITQHIGAYVVEIHGQKITFLDTPGHEAFTAMRMRGAQSTDIAVLVVAADDGVMPQTVEAINHAKAAGVEIIVAVNKIDKPSANVERVKQEMTEYELVPEDWGGSTIFVPVSAHTKEGIPELLEMILLSAEVQELKANPNRNARGLVIEAQLDKGKGPVATMLVQKGTLRVGDNVAVGACYGKVRAMMDDKGRRVKEAPPSTPVEILGLNGVPGAGEIFVSCDSEKEARSFAETFISEGKSKLIEDTKAKLSLDDLFSQIQAGNVKELPIIVKADVQGSVEAVTQSLAKLSNEEVVVKVIHGGVGAINESDVTLASASNAIIIGFNVRPDATAKSIAEQEKVDIRLYRVIYQAIEDVEAAMKGMLDPIFEEQVIGHAVVRQTFRASGVGTIAGSYVLDGKIQRGCSVRISRNGEQIFTGALASLKRFKDDVKEVNTGYECGLSFDKFNDIQEDDMIEAYAMVEVPRQ